MRKGMIQWVLVCLAIVIFVLIVMYTSAKIEANSSRPMPSRQEVIQHPSVSVVSVNPESYSATISGYGELTPHFELTLSAQVDGQITEISPSFEVGNSVNKGDWLVKLEQSDYVSAVKQAEKDVSTAKLTLLQEQRQVEQAKSEWMSSGFDGDPDSELVLRKPQLAEAEANVLATEAALKSAEKDLNQTIITAPFDAVITSRNIALGSYVQSGTDIVSLNSTDRLEVSVPLSSQDWKMIDTSKLDSYTVNLKNVETAQTWPARVLRAAQHVNIDTRQRSIIIAIDSPLSLAEPAYAGMFIDMTLQAKQIDNLWKLPNSSLSQRGEIWYVNEDNTLAKFTATALFSRDNAIFVSPPESLQHQQTIVVSHPLNNYLTGMFVSPELEQQRGE
jgi:membrane fusion protein (multidrug efflux system)